MNIKIIINGFIIIFILHIIIININYSMTIGKEHFKNETESVKPVENSMDFLTNDNNNNDDFKKKLLKYMQQDEPIKQTEFENKNINKVEASNTFISDNNTPNFESNIADISKFYKINYDNLDATELKETSLTKLKTNPDQSQGQSQGQSKDQHFGRDSTQMPDNWNYKNELPMNGGNMNGIIGFDSLESQFAIYNPNKLNLQETDKQKFDNIPHNDLRKPIVYEN